MYYVGVLKFLEEKGCLQHCHFYCISGGNISALLYLSGYNLSSSVELNSVNLSFPFSKSMVFIQSYNVDFRSNKTFSFKMFEILRRKRAQAVACGLCGISDWVKEALDEVLPEDIVERTRGRFSVGFTKYPCGTFIFKHEFENRIDLINAVVSSCTTPPFNIGPRCYRGKCT